MKNTAYLTPLIRVNIIIIIIAIFGLQARSQHNTPNVHKPIVYKHILNDSLNKCTMRMKLQKNAYKEYEPIYGNFTLINNWTEIINIYQLYEYLSGEPNIYIKNSNGIVYAINNVTLRFAYVVATEILPGDSLLFSMPINNWGEATKDIYFDQFGYFPPGSYTAYFYLKEDDAGKYGSAMISNEVSFKIKPLSSEDEEILRLYKQSKYNDVINNYPDNPFTEHIWEWKLHPYWIITNENTENDYNEFILKYNTSSYFAYWRFLLPYLVAIEKKMGDFNVGIEYLKNKHKLNSFMKDVLNNKSYINLIKRYIGWPTN